MAADRGLNEIVAFVREFLEAEAEAARAAVAEPDDDLYLALRARATAYLADITPAMDRFAVPGGIWDQARPDAARNIYPRVLFAVAQGRSAGRSAWKAYVSDLTDPDGFAILDALSTAEIDGRLRIVGRETINPFAGTLEWERTGGTPLRFDGPPDEMRIERLPLDEAHARFLESLAA